MPRMTDEEIDAFLMAGTRTGKLATVREDGRPHVAPIWFVLDGQDILFNTWHDSVKGRNLQRNPRAALTVDEQAPLYAFVLVEGTVELTHYGPSPAKTEIATRIAERYMGAEQARVYGERNAGPGEYLCRLTPTKRIGQRDVAGWE